MSRCTLPIVPLLIFIFAGCVFEESKTELVPPSPFGFAPATPAVTPVSFAAATVSSAARVDSLGCKIIAANRQLGIKPLFRTIGAPDPEIFHRGTTEVIVTEGLVKRCTSDGQLAAVLSLELAKMVGERETAAGPRVRSAERTQPLDVPVGNDYGGSFGSSDQVHRAELAKYEYELRKKAESIHAFDPQASARTYLTAAGFAATELDAVCPMLNSAADNRTFAKQLGGETVKQ